MIERQRIATYGISTTAAATIALALWLKPWQTGSLVAPEPTHVVEASTHRVDIVFAVDTTGSMGGLLDGAKRTVWSIATRVREVDPQADLRVGLVAYKDMTDDSAYVTKDFQLTTDLDSVFQELSGYTARGGGDTPEDVDAALFDAVHKMQWRSDAKKLIFLVGDAPPASRGEVPKYDVTAKVAADEGITINAIRCGGDTETARTWQEVAMLGHGEFSTIRQDGGVQQVATPYDDKMAKLSETIDHTAVIYGDRGVHEGYAAKMAATAAAPEPAKADRASYYATKPAAPRAKEDLVGGAGVDVGSLEADKLPEDMKAMSKTELKAELERRKSQREQAQAELANMAKQRAEYLNKKGTGSSSSFDTSVKTTVEHQLK
jgi:hypothetical protein